MILFLAFKFGSIATSPVVLRWMCDSLRTGCAWRTTPWCIFCLMRQNEMYSMIPVVKVE